MGTAETKPGMEWVQKMLKNPVEYYRNITGILKAIIVNMKTLMLPWRLK